MDSKCSTSAKPNVLLLPEVVFELILHLDFHSLLCCQRVCQTWDSVISRSREAQQKLFLVPDDGPFNAFKAVEERDITTRASAAWEKPSQRIPQRSEFRNLFNPWIFMQGCDPLSLSTNDGASQVRYPYRRPATIWRFTDRVSSGHLDLVFSSADLIALVAATQASWNRMFFTQPPVKRVLLSVRRGYSSHETFDFETDEGIRIGDVMRSPKMVRFAREQRDKNELTTMTLKFDEHFTGVRFMPLQQLVKDQYGNADAKKF